MAMMVSPVTPRMIRLNLDDIHIESYGDDGALIHIGADVIVGGTFAELHQLVGHMAHALYEADGTLVRESVDGGSF